MEYHSTQGRRNVFVRNALAINARSRGDAETRRGEREMTTDIDEITGEIVDAAYKLHTSLGPDLLKSVYETVLARSLQRRGLKVERQKVAAFDFDRMHLDEGLRVDLLVDDAVIVELKSVEKLAPEHSKQLVTYVRLLDLPVGLLVNFGGATLKEGLHRIVNGSVPSTSASLRLRVNLIEPGDLPRLTDDGSAEPTHPGLDTPRE
jgi:iron complex transport system substrate-binding protein